MNFIKKILFVLLLCIVNLSVFSQKLSLKIDSLISTVIQDQNGPGGTFMVAKSGKILYHKAFGKANLEQDVDLKTESVFQIGSMTKQFTAIAILMLEEQGKLDVKQTISAYIPDYPSGDAITIHHLLTHTSGIKDFTKIKSLKDIAQKEISPKMLIDFFKNEPVDFKPGVKFEYNNSGYVVLGYIIELVSGESYEEFINKYIFKKAGMHQSYYASDRQILKNRASGYQKKENGYVNKTIISYSIPFASGSLMSTTNDLLKWQNALTHNTLLSNKFSKKAFTKYKLNSGEELNYGYGWHLKEINKTLSREHGGSIFGYKSMGVYLPNEDLYIVGLTNCDCYSPTQLVRDIAAIVLENEKE
ncbi:penicillin-binding protein 4* [Pedobacter glucosidilyticus]|nr:serine hydrolase domain-containing protein [Pedobacter glucosidilyticus]KHJ36623.1 penicillin-binding protein 4* [Pedobacter glucosidilyticus]